MAIGHPNWINSPILNYDDARRYEYEKEIHYRRQEEEYRRMQNSMYPPGQDLQSKYALTQASKPEPKNPLSFLSNTKLLLTGAST
jgi:hypothetical protein